MWVYLSKTKRFETLPVNLDLASQKFVIIHPDQKHPPWHTNSPENHSPYLISTAPNPIAPD